MIVQFNIPLLVSEVLRYLAPNLPLTGMAVEGLAQFYTHSHADYRQVRR